MESRLAHLALDALFPRFCLSCHKEGSLWCDVCDVGWMARPLPHSCPFCETHGSNATCVSCQADHALDGLSVYLPYGNPVVRQAIAKWKYDGDRTIELVFERWLIPSAARLRPPYSSFCVTHVPIHTTRERSRGFDQSKQIAAWMGTMYAVPIKTLLIRTRKTKPQAKKEHEERRAQALEGIFSIHPSCKEIPESVLLCDDVFTSGATMEAAARCLKMAGVRSVWGFVLAKG